jgi:flagellar biosynthesis component FlhA
LQLIELALIALTSFAILILITFLLSYFGYKTRKRIEQKNETATEYKENTKDQNGEKIDILDLKEKKSNIHTKPEKFIVFNPGLTKVSKETTKEIKHHTPHKLFIKK